KRPGPCGPGLLAVRALDAADVRGAGPLRAVHHLEPHAITLVEGAEPFRPDLRMMHEHVRTTLAGEKTESLGLVEPLDGTFDHVNVGPPWPSLSWQRCLRAFTNEGRTVSNDPSCAPRANG